MTALMTELHNPPPLYSFFFPHYHPSALDDKMNVSSTARESRKVENNWSHDIHIATASPVTSRVTSRVPAYLVSVRCEPLVSTSVQRGLQNNIDRYYNLLWFSVTSNGTFDDAL